MKKILNLLLLLLVFTTSSYAQDIVITDTAGLDVQPEYPGGKKEFYTFVMKNVRVPRIPDSREDLHLKTLVSFVVEKDGSLSTITLLSDPGFGLGDEVVKAIKKSKKWQPGIKDDKPVRARFLLPVTINITANLKKKD